MSVWESFFEVVFETVIETVFETVSYFFISNFLKHFEGELGCLPVRAKPNEPVYAYMYKKGPNINQFRAKY